MQLWRLSSALHAERFDGGYGLLHDGRWNTRGHPVTYCATGPAVCLLERLVHIEDVSMLPDDTMLVRYAAPDDIGLDSRPLAGLPAGWQADAEATRSMGDAWLEGGSAPLLSVPSRVVPVAASDERNLLVNHRHPDAASIVIAGIERFEFDPRLFGFS